MMSEIDEDKRLDDQKRKFAADIERLQAEKGDSVTGNTRATMSAVNTVTDNARQGRSELTRNAPPEIECDYCTVKVPYPVPIFRAYQYYDGGCSILEGAGWSLLTLCMDCAQDDEYFSGSVENCGVNSRFCKSCQRPVAFGRWHKGIREYCSRICYDRDRRPKVEAIACRSCSNTFTPKRTDSKYCSSKCRQKAYRQRSESTNNQQEIER